VEKTQKGIEYASSPTTTERRRLFGGDFSGEMFGLGIRGEGAVNRMEMSEDFGQYLVGADHTFESGLYFIGEYYRNGLGKADPGRYDLDDWIRFLSTEGENLGQDYLFLGERYTIAELLVWSNHVLINLNDKSGTLFPWLDYSLDDNAEVTLVGYIPFGAFGVGGFVRLRAYF